MRKLLLSLTGFAIVFAGAQGLQAGYVYLEDFDSGDGGWDAISTETYMGSGGVGDSGYLQGTRTGLAPTFSPESGSAAANTTGNLEALYGNRIHISYYGRMFAGGNKNVQHLFAGPTVGDDPQKWRNVGIATDIEPFRVDWTYGEFEIDTNWSDAEAQAHGWSPLAATTTSWQDVLHNVTDQNPFYAWQTKASSQSNEGGLDNLRFATVPEPSTLALLCLGVVGLAAFARRRWRL